MTIRANFTDSGLVLGNNDTNMTYLYGLSDFFTVMFQDTSTVNLLLEAESEVASEIYSRFLQYSSSLSLTGIQEATNSTIKLIYLSSADAVAGETNTYVIPENIQSARFLANRPFLPTELLDDSVDYSVTQQTDGTCWVKFAKPISSYALPNRLLSDGFTQQYALWFVDAVVDEQMISKFYGNLLGVAPENASTQFADFVYGLYYVYMHGPNLETLARGLNLVLGIPVARAVETVLSIRKYLETDQYLVVCDQNQYLIPYGLAPTVFEGDVLAIGESLSLWVELKDYEKDGDWWVNLHIPEKLIPEVPLGQKDRYATKGSHYDYLMRNYLKTHTFLVQVNVANFKNLQQYAQISDVINRAKPAYTEAIYIWAITDNETINIKDPITYRFNGTWDDGIHPCISRLHRDNTDDPLSRGRTHFIRYNVDHKVERICGSEVYGNTYQTHVGVDLIQGYVNPAAQFHDNTPAEKGWAKAIMNRGHDAYRGYRDKIGFHRGTPDMSADDGAWATTHYSSWKVDFTLRMVPIYLISTTDLADKMAALSYPAPKSTDWSFEMFSPRSYAQAVDDIAINYLPPNYDSLGLKKNYSVAMTRGNDNNYLGREFGQNSLVTYLPDVSEIQANDYLLCVRITDAVVGVYWITSSQIKTAPAYFPVGEIDPLKITYNMPLSRGGGLNGAPFYVLRGARMGSYNSVDNMINTKSINDQDASGGELVSEPYTDKYNTTISINRSGATVLHAVEAF